MLSLPLLLGRSDLSSGLWSLFYSSTFFGCDQGSGGSLKGSWRERVAVIVSFMFLDTTGTGTGGAGCKCFGLSRK